jgi:hypothetical protein
MLSDESKGYYKIGSFRIEYEVDYRNVKYARLEFKTHRLLLILPKSSITPEEILKRKKNWIERKYKEIKEFYKESKLKKNEILLFGKKFRIIPSKNSEINWSNRTIKINRNKKDKLSKLLKNELRAKAEQITSDYKKTFGICPNKIFIRNQKTKWGSCSCLGNLSLNLRLISLPENLIKYVIFHELIHLKEKKHNDRFWKMVENEFGDYKRLEKLLFKYWFISQNTNFFNSKRSKKVFN